MNLAEKKCIPCSIGTPPMDASEVMEYMKELSKDWMVVDIHHIERTFKFKNFKEALEFTNKVGALAEEEGHHPDIHLSWGRVKLIIYTHKIDGLSEADFVLAAKVEKLL
ncbi:4a-hydroxytetrahydrobiopterin dehydratase [Alkaliphilus serpentinus]|nr:4a-hydroxytetrahydrobiopterin dehydratase [Alkaliphilus serpentinus]